MDEFSEIQLPSRLTLINYTETQNYISGGKNNVQEDANMLADMLTDHDPYINDSDKEEPTYAEVKTFFDDLKNRGVDVKVSLDGSTMSEFFNPMDGGKKNKKSDSKRPRKMNEYMKLSTHIRSILKEKMESQLGGRKIPAIAGTKVISHIINEIKTEEKITDAEHYFKDASSYIKTNYNKLLDMIKKLM